MRFFYLGLLTAMALCSLAPQAAWAQDGWIHQPTGFYSAQGTAPDLQNPATKNARGQDTAQQNMSLDKPPAQTHRFVVTTLDKCYRQLTPAEAAAIKNHSRQPYADCHNKLREKLQARRHYSAAAQAAALTPVTARNFIRVETGRNNPTPANPHLSNPAPQDGIPNSGPNSGYWRAGQK